MHPKGANSMAIDSALETPWLALGGPFLSSYAQTACHLWAQLWKHLGWHWMGHFCPPMHKRAEKIVFSPFRPPIPAVKLFFPVWVSGCWSRAVAIVSLLMGGCGLSQKRVEDGCKDSCMYEV